MRTNRMQTLSIYCKRVGQEETNCFQLEKKSLIFTTKEHYRIFPASNNKSTNIIRNKTCNTSNGSIEEIKMDKGFIIDKYIKVHSINQCVHFNNIVIEYPDVVQLTPCVIKDTTSRPTTTVLMECINN